MEGSGSVSNVSRGELGLGLGLGLLRPPGKEYIGDCRRGLNIQIRIERRITPARTFFHVGQDFTPPRPRPNPFSRRSYVALRGVRMFITEKLRLCAEPEPEPLGWWSPARESFFVVAVAAVVVVVWGLERRLELLEWLEKPVADVGVSVGVREMAVLNKSVEPVTALQGLYSWAQNDNVRRVMLTY